MKRIPRQLRNSLLELECEYTNTGCPNRVGWKGVIKRVSNDGQYVYIAWAPRNHGFNIRKDDVLKLDVSRYTCIALVLDDNLDERSYIYLTNGVQGMRNHTVTNNKFSMVVSKDGDLKSAKITRAEAEELAKELAQGSQNKETFFVVDSVAMFYAEKPPITKRDL